MLVLTRRANEKLVIGNEIVIEVLSANNDGVRLGISAPRETSVHRYEVFVEIEAANRAAAASVADQNSLAQIAASLKNEKQ